MDITFNDWLNLPPDRRKGGAILRPKALYAFTAVSIEVAMESFRLRDELRTLLPEFDRRVLHDEKRPYLQHTLDRMMATAHYLFERRKGLGNRNAEPWKRQLRITTNRAIFFGGSLCGGSYVEAAMMLASGIVAAVCSMMPDQAEQVDNITPFLPRMPAPEYFTAIEENIRRTTHLIETILSEWPDFNTFLNLCVEEFLGTVDRLGIRLPDGQSWREFISKRHPTEAPPSEVSHELHDETAAAGVTGILTALQRDICVEVEKEPMTVKALADRLYKSEDAVKKAIRVLKGRGIVGNKPGRGYYRTDKPPAL